MIKPDLEEITEWESTDIVFVILYLTRRNHYNLIGWKQPGSIVQYCFTYLQVPPMIHEAFSLSPSTTVPPPEARAASPPTSEGEDSDAEASERPWDRIPDS